MKLVAIVYSDSVDLSLLAIGAKPITVSDGTNSVPGGEVMAKTELKESNPVLVPHTHQVAGATGPATV